MRYIKGRWIKRPRKKKRYSFKYIIIIAVTVFLTMAVMSELALANVDQDLTLIASKQYVADAISQMVQESLKDSDADFTVINSDSTGKIVSVNMNTASINSFKAELTEKIQKKLNGNTTVRVPIGSFTDVAVLNGRGFKVPLKLNFVGTVSLDFSSEFATAGVNQSCHRIYLDIEAKTVSQSKSFSADSDYSTNMLLSETVVVGEVPDLIAGLGAA